MASSALCLALWAASAVAQDAAGGVRLVVQSSALAGFGHHAAADVWGELRVGDELALAREAGNPHDANAVSISWRGRKLGYVPRKDNAVLAWSLDRGDTLRARISRLTEHPNPARRIEFEVFAQ
ncbi:MAG TPA: HIRAN domain-containing protein [Burkholderiales bacterium]|nr:HIRAN domain-containing protein [Burkholderiales bacterium]